MANLLIRREGEPYPGQFFCVCEASEEDASKYGWGHSMKEAQLDWGEKLMERVDDHIWDMRDRGEIDLDAASMTFTALDELVWVPALI